MAALNLPSEDNSNSGIWFLSYLCEIGFIENDDHIDCSFVYGKVLKSFCNIPAGHSIYIQMDKPDEMLIKYASDAEVTMLEDDNDGDSWFNHPGVAQMHKKISISLI